MTGRSMAAMAVRVLVLAAISSCAGDGCSCTTPIPGGFPSAKRVENAIQVRVSDSLFDKLESDPAALVASFTGSDTLSFPIPSSCGGTVDVCCNVQGPCGPLAVDVTEQNGDLPRLELVPVAGQSAIDLTLRARLHTESPIVVGSGLLSCNVTVDTSGGSADDVTIRTRIALPVGAGTNTTEVVLQAQPGDDDKVTLVDLENADIDLGLCGLVGNTVKGLLIDEIKKTLSDQLVAAVEEPLCKTCPTGVAADCGDLADACSDGVCMRGGSCLQELGTTGRILAALAFADFSPGQSGAADLYEVAGGYATSNAGGVSAGVLSGMLPAGAERDRCGPVATPPPATSIPQSTIFQGNTRPGGGAFDIALGIHQHVFDQLGWAFYEGGLLCIDVGTETVDLLTTDTIALVMPSLTDLLHGEVGRVTLGLRPQKPPTFTIGAGTTDGDGNILDPLLTIRLDDLDIDFYVVVDEQPIRVMVLNTDLTLPLNLEVDDQGKLVPVLGDVGDAFANVTVRDSEALSESPDELAKSFPALLALALPSLADGLGNVELPALGPFQLTIAPGGVTAVENQTFVALFGDLVPASSARAPVSTRADVALFEVPELAELSAPGTSSTPRLELALGGDGARDLEWSIRIDGGFWTPYSPNPHPVLSHPILSLQGRHRIEVRARAVGQPATTDPSPVTLTALVDRIPPSVRTTQLDADSLWVRASDNVSGTRLRARYRVRGSSWRLIDTLPARIALDGPASDVEVQVEDESGNVAHVRPNMMRLALRSGSMAESGGCGSSGGASMPMALLLALVLLARRRRAFTAIASMALVAAVSACGGDSPCIGGQCQEGEVPHGPVGRYASVTSEARNAWIAAYDDRLGDLVVIHIDADGKETETVVDGVPDGVQPVYSPSGYRRGIDEAGPDVGRHTSIARADDTLFVAYQDVDSGALKMARKSGKKWLTHVVDDDGVAGLYGSLVVTSAGTPAIAYMATNLRQNDGSFTSELRVATTSTAEPGPDDWSIATVASAPASCAATCADGEACIDDGSAERCVVTASSCPAACADDEACIAGSCQAKVALPTAVDLPTGTGLFASLLETSAGLAVAYYDRSAGAVAVATSSSAGWTEVVQAQEGDHGRYLDAVAQPGGPIHLAYQGPGKQLFYTTFSSGAFATPEVVDDGVHEEAKTHPVGASASIFLRNGEPNIVYQDGAKSDVWRAQRSATAWSKAAAFAGDELYGFFIDTAVSDGIVSLVDFVYDRSVFPPGELRLETLP